MVDAVLGEIGPEDAEKLWVVQSKIVAEQTNDEAIDFKLSSRCACRMLQECRTMGITKRNRIYYGRQMMDFETLQNWLHGLTWYRFKIARHHRILQGRGSVVSAVTSRRMYFF